MKMSLKQWADNGWLRAHQASQQEVIDLLKIVDRDLPLFEVGDRSPITKRDLDTAIPPLVAPPPNVVDAKLGFRQIGIGVECFAVREQPKFVHASGATFRAA